MKFGRTSNPSPYRIFTAAETIDAFKAVTFGDGGLSLGGDYPIGLTTAETDSVKAGDDVNVQIFGGGYWTAGASITAGAFLASDSLGNAVEAATGKFAFARAIESASAGDAAQVIIINGGKV